MTEQEQKELHDLAKVLVRLTEGTDWGGMREAAVSNIIGRLSQIERTRKARIASLTAEVR